MKIEHWVKWLTPGVFMPEEANRKITTRDLSKLEIPRDVYTFTFYDIKTVNATDEEGKPHEISTTINTSPRYLIGEVFTLEEIEAFTKVAPLEYRALAFNVEQWSDTKRGVRTHLGNWQPLLEDDIVLSKEDVKFTEPVLHKKM